MGGKGSGRKKTVKKKGVNHESHDRWQKETFKRYTFSLNRKYEPDTIEWLDQNKGDNISEMFKKAIRVRMMKEIGTKEKYYREYYFKRDMVEIMDEDFNVLARYEITKDQLGKITAKETGLPVTDGLIRVAKRGDISTALRRTRLINEDWVEVGEVIEMTEEQIRNIHKNLEIKR